MRCIAILPLMVLAGCGGPTPAPVAKPPASPSATPTAAPSATTAAVAPATPAPSAANDDEWSAKDAAAAREILDAELRYFEKLPAAGPMPIGPGDMSSEEGMFGWKNGQLVEITVAVHPARASERDCILPDVVDGLRCRLKTAEEPFAKPIPADKELHYFPNEIANVPVLAAGLWSLPLPKARLDKHPDVAVSMRCKLRVVGRAMMGYHPRRALNFEYSPGPYEIGRFESCKLLPAKPNE